MSFVLTCLDILQATVVSVEITVLIILSSSLMLAVDLTVGLVASSSSL